MANEKVRKVDVLLVMAAIEKFCNKSALTMQEVSVRLGRLTADLVEMDVEFLSEDQVKELSSVIEDWGNSLATIIEEMEREALSVRSTLGPVK